MTKNFPKFAAHHLASCFNCGSDLDGTYWGSGYGHGNGQFRQDCPKCGMFTCYDIKEKEAA